MMREFLRIILEADQAPLTREELLEAQISERAIPDTQWGYWIDPDGEFFPVNTTHALTMEDIGGPGTLPAMRAGWIRVVMGGHSLDVHVFAGCPTERAISVLARLAKQYPRERYNCDIDMDYLVDLTPDQRQHLSDMAGGSSHESLNGMLMRLSAVRRP